MNGTLTLNNPIYINDKEIRSLDYDTNEITVAMFAEADAKKKTRAGRNAGVSIAAETDFSLHIYLGMMAIIALNSGIDTSDLERLKGYDASRLAHIGRYFFVAPSEAPSLPRGSDGQSGTIAEHSTPLGETSKANA